MSGTAATGHSRCKEQIEAPRTRSSGAVAVEEQGPSMTGKSDRSWACGYSTCEAQRQNEVGPDEWLNITSIAG